MADLREAAQRIIDDAPPATPAGTCVFVWKHHLDLLRDALAAPPPTPSYDALLLIVQSVCGALERAGVTDPDDPGEAIDVLRERWEKTAHKPAGAVPMPEPFDIRDVQGVTLEQCEAYGDAREAAARAAGGVLTTGERDVIETLLVLAYKAWCLADDTEDAGGEKLNVVRSDFDALSESLDKLNELPDDQPGYTMGESAKARWALRRILDPLSRQPAAQGERSAFQMVEEQEAEKARNPAYIVDTSDGSFVPVESLGRDASLKTADDRILWGVVANAGRLSKERKVRWGHVSDATGQGSNYSADLCRRFGFDPNEEVGGRRHG